MTIPPRRLATVWQLAVRTEVMAVWGERAQCVERAQVE